MRKASREMDAAFALEVLDKAPYVTVSMIKSDGSPYGLPLSLARTDENTFYFHCALEGDKLDCIRHCPTVFLSWKFYATIQICNRRRQGRDCDRPRREDCWSESYLSAFPPSPHGCF